MSKTTKISNISDEKLLNGEMNENGININNSIKKFALYDRVLGVLDVDSNNKAIDENDDGVFNFNVYIRRNGKEEKSERITIPNEDSDYIDRPIDTIFPFSEIKRVLLNRQGEINDGFFASNFDYKNNNSDEYNHLNIYSKFVKPSIFNNGYSTKQDTTLYGIDKQNQYSKETDDNFLFTRIPKFYCRTWFEDLGNDKYTRNYEVISEEVYNNLDDENKIGFFVPWAFYTWGQDEYVLEPTEGTDVSSQEIIFDFLKVISDDVTSFKIKKIEFENITEEKILSGGYSLKTHINNKTYYYYDLEVVKQNNEWTVVNGYNNTPFSNITIVNNKLDFVLNSEQDLEHPCKMYIETKYTERKEKNNLFISSQPISRNFTSMPYGSKNNIISFDYFNINDSKKTPFNNILNRNIIDSNTYYGVLCYLLRLYTGCFDISELFENDETKCSKLYYTHFNNSTNSTTHSISQGNTLCLEFDSTNIVDSNNTNNFFISNNNECYIKIEKFNGNIKNLKNCKIFYSDNLTNQINNLEETGQPFHFELIQDPEDSSKKIISFDMFGASYNQKFTFLTNAMFYIDTQEVYIDGNYLNRTLPLGISFLHYGYDIQDPTAKMIPSIISTSNEFLSNSATFFRYNNNICCRLQGEYYNIFNEYNINNGNVGFVFYVYEAESYQANETYLYKTIPLHIKKYDSNNILKNECILDCFFNRDDNFFLYSDLNFLTLKVFYEYEEINNTWYKGACLNKAYIHDYLKNLFNPNTIGTDKITITVFSDPWANLSSAFENNKYFPLQLLDKNKRIGNQLTLMNITGLFREPRFDYYNNIDFTLNKNRIINDFVLGAEIDNPVETTPITTTFTDFQTITFSIEPPETWHSYDNTEPTPVQKNNIFVLKDLYLKKGAAEINVFSYNENADFIMFVPCFSGGVIKRKLFVNNEQKDYYSFEYGGGNNYIYIEISTNELTQKIEIKTVFYAYMGVNISVKVNFYKTQTLFDGWFDSKLQYNGIFNKDIYIKQNDIDDYTLCVNAKANYSNNLSHIELELPYNDLFSNYYVNKNYFVCDNIIENIISHGYLEKENKVFYSKDFSFLEIPSQHNDNYSSSFVFPSNAENYSKRAAHSCVDESFTEHINSSSFGCFCEFVDETQILDIKMKPSLYSLSFNNNKLVLDTQTPYYSIKSQNYGFLYFDYLNKNSYLNDPDFMLCYNNILFFMLVK